MNLDTLILEYLETLQADLTSLTDHKGFTLIHLAVLAKRPDIIHSLVKHARETFK